MTHAHYPIHLDTTVSLEITQFDNKRLKLHAEMARAYHKFLDFVFVQNEGDDALHRSMNETRIKFLTMYYVTHAPVSPIFSHRLNLQSRESADRRYIVADYYSQNALKALRKFPSKGLELAFEHVVPKDLMRQECEARAKVGDVPTAKEIKKMLDRSWHIAVVTKDEDRMLKPSKGMPTGWMTGDDVLARYRMDPKTMRFDLFRTIEDAEKCRSVLAGSTVVSAK